MQSDIKLPSFITYNIYQMSIILSGQKKYYCKNNILMNYPDVKRTLLNQFL